MSLDCTVCHATMASPEPGYDPTPFCASCAFEMLSYAQDLAVDAFLNVDIHDADRAYVVVGEDTGPAIVDTRYGPWPLGEAYRRAKRYSVTGNLAGLLGRDAVEPNAGTAREEPK